MRALPLWLAPTALSELAGSALVRLVCCQPLVEKPFLSLQRQLDSESRQGEHSSLGVSSELKATNKNPIKPTRQADRVDSPSPLLCCCFVFFFFLQTLTFYTSYSELHVLPAESFYFSQLGRTLLECKS